MDGVVKAVQRCNMRLYALARIDDRSGGSVSTRLPEDWARVVSPLADTLMAVRHLFERWGSRVEDVDQLVEEVRDAVSSAAKDLRDSADVVGRGAVDLQSADEVTELVIRLMHRVGELNRALSTGKRQSDRLPLERTLLMVVDACQAVVERLRGEGGKSGAVPAVPAVEGMLTFGKSRGAPVLTAAGQRARTVVDVAAAPFTRLTEFDFELWPGDTGWPHRHREVTPLVRIERGGPVATFIGWELEELVWIHAGERGVIDGTKPHWCVYPRRRIGGFVPRWLQGPARGSETRNAKTVAEDTVRLPQLWPIARQRIAERGWVVSFPPDMPAAE